MRSSDELLLVFICGKVHPKRAKLNNRKGMVLKMTKEEIANIRHFLVETFAFTDEQSAAIDKQIPMTQELFESILERCNELGTDTDKLFYRLLIEYPDLTEVYGKKIEQEINEKYADIDFPEETPEEKEAAWERLCVRIKEKYGEDAI